MLLPQYVLTDRFVTWAVTHEIRRDRRVMKRLSAYATAYAATDRGSTVMKAEATGLRGWAKRTFSALESQHYRRYWISQMLSQTGSWMQATAQQYLVLELTNNSSSALGNVTMVQFLPTLLLALFAGAMIDRLPRRGVLLATQVVFLMTSAALAISTYSGHITLQLVMGLAFVSGMANAFDMPARQSMVVDFVPRSVVPNAVALNSLAFNTSRTLGQALFGVVAAAGTALLASQGGGGPIRHLSLPFFLNVASFFYVLYVLATLPFPTRDMGRHGNVWEDIREGLSFVARTPAVKNVMLLVGALSLTIINFNVIIPYFARAVFGAKEGTFGLMSACFGVGAVAGALWQASKPNPLRNLRLGTILMLLSASTLAFVPSVGLSLPVLAACGFGMLTFMVSANSAVQLSIPDTLRGRVMSLYSFVFVGMAPPGAYIASHMISKDWILGPHWGLLALSGLGALVALTLWGRLPRQLVKPTPDKNS